MQIDARGMDYTALNNVLRAYPSVEISNCLGQRFLGAGMSGKQIAIRGIPGNALGAYLNGAEITVFGNAQDAVGDTMNDGRIVIHGNVGDAAGYAMRGGRIFVKGSAATAPHKSSAPSSEGLSMRRGSPLRIPGPTMRTRTE